MRRERRSRREWERLVEELDGSGLSAREFAAARDLGLTTLRRWRWHFGGRPRRHRKSVHGDASGELLEVQLSPNVSVIEPAAESRAEAADTRIALPGGIFVELCSLPTPSWLADLCHALEGR